MNLVEKNLENLSSSLEFQSFINGGFREKEWKCFLLNWGFCLIGDFWGLKRLNNGQILIPKISLHLMYLLTNSNLTWKQRDQIREVTARRRVTSDSWFWNFIWDTMVCIDPITEKKFPFECCRRDAQTVPNLGYLGSFLGPCLGPPQGPF